MCVREVNQASTMNAAGLEDQLGFIAFCSWTLKNGGMSRKREGKWRSWKAPSFHLAFWLGINIPSLLCLSTLPRSFPKSSALISSAGTRRGSVVAVVWQSQTSFGFEVLFLKNSRQTAMFKLQTQTSWFKAVPAWLGIVSESCLLWDFWFLYSGALKSLNCLFTLGAEFLFLLLNLFVLRDIHLVLL